MLHRILEKELITVADVAKESPSVPVFILKVAKAESGALIHLSNITHAHFMSFLKYCYVEIIDDKITCDDISNLANLTKELQLPHLHAMFANKLEVMREHLR